MDAHLASDHVTDIPKLRPVCGELLIFDTNQQFATHTPRRWCRSPNGSFTGCEKLGAGSGRGLYLDRHRAH